MADWCSPNLYWPIILHILLASVPITDLHSSLFKLLSLELFHVHRSAIVSVVDTEVGAFFECINTSCILNFIAFWGCQILSHFSESVFRTGFALPWSIGSFLYFVMKTVICLWIVKSHIFVLRSLAISVCVWDTSYEILRCLIIRHLNISQWKNLLHMKQFLYYTVLLCTVKFLLPPCRKYWMYWNNLYTYWSHLVCVSSWRQKVLKGFFVVKFITFSKNVGANLTLSDPTQHYDFPVPLRCRKTSNTFLLRLWPARSAVGACPTLFLM
jgi:hypothetical protein